MTCAKAIKIVMVLALMSIFLFGCEGFPKDIPLLGKLKRYRDEKGYDSIRVMTESAKSQYPFGKSIPIRITVRNDSNQPFVFDTKGKPITEYYTDAGLEDPRPVYDLIFMGGYIDESGLQVDYSWVWSQHTKEPAPTKITLQPHEERVLIDTLWEPPEVRYMQGRFVGRFADLEFPTGVGIEPPKR